MGNIISTQDLTTYLNQGSLTNGVASQAVAAVNDWIGQTTHRSFGDVVTVTERYDFASSFYLKHQDVVDIESVKLGYPGQAQTTLGSDAYIVNTSGRLTLALSPAIFQTAFRGRDYVQVEYSHGVKVVPQDLKQAALAIAGRMYNWAKAGGKDVTASQVGSYRLEFRDTATGSGQRDPANSVNDLHWAVIDSYRMQRV